MSDGRIVEAIKLGTLEAAVAAAEAMSQFGVGAEALPPDGATITGSQNSVSIIPANSQSVGLVIAVHDPNDKTTFISFEDPAVLNKGTALIPGLAPVLLIGSFSQAEIFAITTAAGAKISWQQFIVPS